MFFFLFLFLNIVAQHGNMSNMSNMSNNACDEIPCAHIFFDRDEQKVATNHNWNRYVAINRKLTVYMFIVHVWNWEILYQQQLQQWCLALNTFVLARISFNEINEFFIRIDIVFNDDSSLSCRSPMTIWNGNKLVYARITG